MSEGGVKRTYREPPPTTLDAVRVAIEDFRNARARVSESLIGAVLGVADHHKELEEIALDLLNGDDETLAHSGAQALGHLARIYQDVDLGRVLPALREAVDRGEMSGAASDALDDVHTYMCRRAD